MKNTEIKKGTILYANTGVAVKVLEYSPKFGGRVLIERADGIKGGKPMWRPLEKFSEKNSMDKMSKGGSIKDSDIKEGAEFKLANGEVISIKKVAEDNWVEYSRNGEIRENSVKQLKIFINNWRDKNSTKENIKEFENLEIVWDNGNKSYGVILDNYGGSKKNGGEVRLDSDGNQPIENLHKLGSSGDKGTKKQLEEALKSHKKLVDNYDYEKVNYAKGGGVDQKIIDELWKGYASAILFTENDSDTEEPLENNYSISDFDEKTVKSSKILLKKFYSENKEAIIESELKLFTVGSNVWYTRAGHGVGFFDHNLDLDLERKLTKGAKALGEYPNVESYDGKISVRGGRVFSKGGGVESKQNEVYIEYYNKDKNFSIDKKYFKTYEDAVKWAQKNFDKFDPDMIKYVYAKGGDIVNFIKTKFNSHKNHNPNYDILEGYIDKDSFITYAVKVTGENIGKESMEYYTGENYVVGSKKKSSSRHFDSDKIPVKYKSSWLKLKELYNTEKYDKGGDVPKSFEYSIGGL